MKRRLALLSAALALTLAASISTADAQSVPPPNAAVGVWMMHHGASSLRGMQLLRGAITGPNVRCSGSISNGSEGDPAIGDINGDGYNEIVILNYSGIYLNAYDGRTCGRLWRVSVGSGTGWGTPALGDVTPDYPGLEIIINVGGNIQARRGTDGALIWSRSFSSSLGAVTIQDVDGDGYGEIFVIAGSLYALDGDGSTIWSYSGSNYFGNVAVFDINNDSFYEVIGVVGNYVRVFRATDGTLLWSYYLGREGNPAVGDLDNDGYAEVVINTGNGHVYAFHHDGTLYWDRNTGCGSYWGRLNSTTIADVTGDGYRDVLFGCMPYSTGYLYVLRGTDGTTQWSYSGTRSGYQALGRKIADLDGDGVLEIIITGARYGSAPYLAILQGTDGSLEWSYSSDYFEGTSIGDVDNDSCMELVSSGDFSSTTFYIFDSPDPAYDCGITSEDGDLGSYEKKVKEPIKLLVKVRGRVVEFNVGSARTLLIYDATGRLVRTLQSSNGKAKTTLSSGVYIVKVEGVAVSSAFVVK
ncbi:MAG: PQQ-binding-like beta-propeller repeat protein [Thermotogae bacterium]|nr:PQQ-binding-like beta-propeller repeat protein [Thermotogota bacterium]